jgi:outer membrane biosynthesis protein TonB
MMRLLLTLLLCASLTAIRAQKTDSAAPANNQQDTIKAQFPGGDQAWGKYIQAAMLKNFSDLYQNGAKGTTEVQFLVQADGSIDSVTVVHKTGTCLDKFAVNIIKDSPQWIPAMKGGQNIKCFRRQKITVDPPR